MAYTIVLDAGHGGSDSGAVYNGRQEKDDSLRLTMEVGKILSNNGYNVIYTRTNDEYDTPFEKATIANEENADLFVSIHRNSSPVADMFNGVQTLVYSNNGIRANLARNINQNLVQLGFENQGVVERPNLVVLKRTKMPAVLVEVGFINSSKDNQIFDGQFTNVASAIANGIISTVGTGYENTYRASMMSKVQNEEWEYDADSNQIDRIQMSESQMSESQMSESQMNGTQMNGTQMNGTQMYGNRMNGTQMNETRMNGTQMNGTQMNGTQMNGTQMNRTQINETQMNETLINETQISESQMSGNQINENQSNLNQALTYVVQVGAFRNRLLAENQARRLINSGYPAILVNEKGLFKVWVGKYSSLDNAADAEKKIKELGYDAYIRVVN